MKLNGKQLFAHLVIVKDIATAMDFLLHNKIYNTKYLQYNCIIDKELDIH